MTDAERLERIKAIDTADGHQTLIRAQWKDFASFAWKRYLSEGRGAIVIDMTALSKKARAFRCRVIMWPTGARSLLRAAAGLIEKWPKLSPSMILSKT